MTFKVPLLYFITALYFGLATVVLLAGKNRNASRGFSLFAFALMAWSLGLARYFAADDLSECAFWGNFIYTAGSFIASSFLLFSFIYPNPRFRHLSRKTIVILAPSVIIGALAFATRSLVNEVVMVDGVKTFIYGPSRVLWEVYFNSALILAFYRFFKLYVQSSGLRKIQYLHITIANLTINILAGFTNVFLLWFGIQDYIWSGPPLTLIWFLMISYSIFKYHVIDLRIAVTSMGILLTVYTFVLGVPFAAGWWGREYFTELVGVNWWLIPTGITAALATLGPFLYTRVRREAEERILADELRVRDLLIRVSRGMADIRDTRRLLRLIRHVLSRTLRARAVRIFLKNQGAGYRAVEGTDQRKLTLGHNDPLVTRLRAGRDIIVADELPVKLKPSRDESAAVAACMREIQASLAVPLVIRDELEGFVTLGGRLNHEPWTDNILGSLRVMANQTVLALENCRHFEAEKERLTLENATERRESLDMLVATMAHEIDNPITGVIGQADMVRMLVELVRERIPPETYADILHALQYINTDAWRVARIVKSVEDYSKGGEGSLSPTSVAGALEPYRPLAQLQFKKAGGVITYTEEVEPDLPEVMAEVVLIEEILMNYMENALHAVSRLTTEKRIHLSITRQGDFVRIEVRDNGYGMTPKVARQVFEVPTTTKGSSEGTGLGLYRVRKICGILGARYGGESPGPGQGSSFRVEIPVIKEKTDAPPR